MTTLAAYLSKTDSRISAGAEFQWACYGRHAHSIDTITEYGEASCVYDTESQILYEVSAHDSLGRKESYRWINPTFIDAYKAEAKSRNLDWKEFLEDERWSDTDSLEDMLDKVYGILNNRRFDHNVVMTLELEEDVLETIQRAALIKGITIDAFIEQALQAVVDSQPDSAKVTKKKKKQKKPKDAV